MCENNRKKLAYVDKLVFVLLSILRHELRQTAVSPVLMAISQSNGNGQTSTLTESKPLNRLR